jgi:hypothetical protein
MSAAQGSAAKKTHLLQRDKTPDAANDLHVGRAAGQHRELGIDRRS